MQVPWFRQGLEAHSLMLVWQLGPVGIGARVDGPASLPCAFTLEGQRPSLRCQQLLPVLQVGCIESPRPPGRTCLAVSPTTLTTEAFSAGAHIATGHVFAGATVDTRVRLTLIVVDVTVCSTPPRGTVTFVPIQSTVLQPGLRALLLDYSSSLMAWTHLLGHYLKVAWRKPCCLRPCKGSRLGQRDLDHV